MKILFYNKEGAYIPEDFTGEIIWPDGHIEFTKNGLVHADNGPAVFRTDGGLEWYKHGNKLSYVDVLELCELTEEQREYIIWNLDKCL